MKTIMYIVFFTIVCLWIAETSIQFKPFKITVEKPMLALGWIFLVLAIAFWQTQSGRDGYKSGYEDGVKDTIEIMESTLKTVIQPKEETK